MGLDRESPARSDVAGTKAAHPVVDARGSGPTDRNPARALGSDGAVLPRDGLRRSNVTGLLWSRVDLTRRTAWVHADQAKARKAIAVPLSAAAVIVIREQIGKHSTHMFSFRGKPVRQVNTKAWRLTLKRVGIEDFRWHDLRHTWASWHVQAGTPLYVLQELGSWECVEMVRKYAHLASDHLVQYVDRMSGLRVVQDGKVATFPATAAK